MKSSERQGNRCGHQPGSPRPFVPPATHKARPAILVRLGERLQDYYEAPQAILPSLNRANGSDRQQRSERREACLIVLGALIHYLDLVTLRVGVPLAGGAIAGLTVDFLVERTGLNKRRVERATRDLERAGILTVHRVVHADGQGGYRGQGAIRTVTHRLFAVFGLAGWLSYERNRASAKRRKLRLKGVKRDQARRDLLIGDLFDPPPSQRSNSPNTPNRTVELTRLMDAHPELSVETLFEKLGRRPQTSGNHPA